MGAPEERCWRTATREAGGPCEFGDWKSWDAALLEMLTISRQWEEMGLKVKRWGELFPMEADRNRLVGILPKRRRWTFITEVVYRD